MSKRTSNVRKSNQAKNSYGPFTNRAAEQELIDYVNNQLLRCKEQIDGFEIPDFGSNLFYGDDLSCVFYNTSELVASTVADRFSNKFERPNRSNVDTLRANAISDWIDFEQSHLKKWDFRGNHGSRSIIYRSRELIKKWLLPTKRHQKSFWQYLEDAPIQFGPGESFNSTQGDVSQFSKLKNLDNWTVTVDAAPLAAWVIATNKGLRDLVTTYLVRKRIKEAKFKTRSRMAHHSVYSVKNCIGMHLSISRMTHIVLTEFLYEHPWEHPSSRVKMGARGTSVYKNSKKRRFINIECFLNIIIEMMIGYAFRMCLAHNAKNSLDDGQDRHRWLITQPNKTTLDESNASDSIHTKLTAAQLPTRIHTLVNTVRAPYILLNTPHTDKTGSFTKKEWHPVIKTSSMGNGYTFELLTLTLLSIVRLFDAEGSVYGDDIVCSDDSAKDIITGIRAAGFIVNEKKSFVAKPLKESCGRFFLENYGSITCYDIKWCHNINDVIQTANKLGRIVRFNKPFMLTSVLEATHTRILAKIPALLKGPIVSTSDHLPLWVEDSRYFRSHMSSKLANAKWKTYSKGGVCERLNQHWQLLPQNNSTLLGLGCHLTGTDLLNDLIDLQKEQPVKWVVCLLPEPTKKIRQRKIVDNVRSKALVWTYILGGMVTDQLFRVQTQELKWGYKPTLVSELGHGLRAATAREIACSE